MTTSNKAKSNDNTNANNSGIVLADLITEEKKDLTKANLVKFLNGFSIDVPDWDTKHKAKFESVLNGSLVSSQLCEFASLGYFLTRKKINLIDPTGKQVDFSEVFKMSDILKDSELVKKEKKSFSPAQVRFYKKFLSEYALVFISIAKGVKEYDSNIEGIHGKEGKQVLSFLSLLNKLGYKYK